MKTPFINTALLPIFILLISCSGSDAPTAQDVTRYLRSQTPEYLDISLDSMKVFPSGDGTGRISVAVDFAYNQNIYLKDDHNAELYSSFVNQKWDKNWVRYLLRKKFSRSGSPMIYTIAQTRGKKEKLLSEINYIETTEGFDFSGNLKAPQVNGVPEKRLPDGSIIAGTSKFEEYRSSIIDIAENQNNLYEEIQKTIDRWFTSVPIQVFLSEKRNREYKMKFIASMKPSEGYWFTKNNYSEPKLQLKGSATWVSEGTWANNRYSRGNAHPIRVIVNTRIEDDDMWYASINILVPDKRRPGQFYHTGWNLPFRGDPPRYEGRGHVNDMWLVRRTP